MSEAVFFDFPIDPVDPLESAQPVQNARPSAATHVGKRVFDVLSAMLLLVLALPLLLAAALAVKLTTRGPVFFRQARLGLEGKEFKILKFRTMYDGAHAHRRFLLERNEQDGGGILFKIREDPRITKVGRWLRRLSIDELPQLINVLRGQMSMIGPRPLASEDSSYSGEALRRLMVRPGITGLWQVSGRSELSWDDAVRLDLHYIDTWSVGLDARILVRTVKTVITRSGAW